VGCTHSVAFGFMIIACRRGAINASKFTANKSIYQRRTGTCSNMSFFPWQVTAKNLMKSQTID